MVSITDSLTGCVSESIVWSSRYITLVNEHFHSCTNLVLIACMCDDCKYTDVSPHEQIKGAKRLDKFKFTVPTQILGDS